MLSGSNAKIVKISNLPSDHFYMKFQVSITVNCNWQELRSLLRNSIFLVGLQLLLVTGQYLLQVADYHR